MTRMIAVLAIALISLAGCSAASNDPPAADSRGQVADQPPFELNAAPVETTEVTSVKSYRFDPQVIEVSVGSEVIWTNEDDFPHNVHLLDGSDVTLDLPIGESVSLAFDEAGDYYYECSLHPQQMRGKVIVTE